MSFQVLREIKMEHFDASLYKTSQIFYPSKDGTKIPMFIVTKSVCILRNKVSMWHIKMEISTRYY